MMAARVTRAHSSRPRGGPGKPRRTSRRRRAYGQHFLMPGPTVERAVASFSPIAGEAVLEIGPGRGVLTRHLLAAGARVLAVELDLALCQSLEADLASRPGFQLIQADVLKLDLRHVLEETFGSQSVRVFSSLPYSSGTAILEKICDLMPPVATACVLLQQEVAERITARPGDSDYGYLSVVVASRCRAKPGERVRPGAFDHPPRVVSRWLELVPLAEPPVPAEKRAAFLKFCGLLFRHPRKTLANNLRASGYGAPALAAARDTGDPTGRPGTWDVERLAELHARVLALHGAVLE